MVDKNKTCSNEIISACLLIVLSLTSYDDIESIDEADRNRTCLLLVLSLTTYDDIESVDEADRNRTCSNMR